MQKGGQVQGIDFAGVHPGNGMKPQRESIIEKKHSCNCKGPAKFVVGFNPCGDDCHANRASKRSEDHSLSPPKPVDVKNWKDGYNGILSGSCSGQDETETMG